MSLPTFNPRTLALCALIAITGLLRFVLNLDQDWAAFGSFSPIGAMAIFGGAFFSRPYKAFGFPLLTLFISDMALSLTVYSSYSKGFLYGGWWWVYGAFVLMTIAGRIIIRRNTPVNVLVAALSAIFIHWTVTDLGVWLGSTMYPQTFSGYLACLVAAIPFEGNFGAGTIAYSAILFGGFAWMQQRFPQLAKSAR
jgi:hypothetical protein